MFRQTDPENAAKIDRIATMLTALSIGQSLSYDAISNEIGVNITDHRHLLVRARDQVEKSLGCIFEVERGNGIRRLESSAVPEVGLSAIGKIRRAAKRTKKRLGRVNANSLTMAETQRVVGYQAMLGAIATVADGRRAQAVGAVADPTRPIPPENILQMFVVKT